MLYNYFSSQFAFYYSIRVHRRVAHPIPPGRHTASQATPTTTQPFPRLFRRSYRLRLMLHNTMYFIFIILSMSLSWKWHIFLMVFPQCFFVFTFICIIMCRFIWNQNYSHWVFFLADTSYCITWARLRCLLCLLVCFIVRPCLPNWVETIVVHLSSGFWSNWEFKCSFNFERYEGWRHLFAAFILYVLRVLKRVCHCTRAWL